MNDTSDQPGGDILIVEDSPVMVRTLTSLLESHGYKIAGVANDGIEAIKLYKEISPSIVIMDINMPKLDGINATKAIRKINPNAKIVIVSVASDRDIVLSVISAGASDFITKPVNPQRLITVINRLMAG
jgi:two-component system chemotaxis response regulator CheY